MIYVILEHEYNLINPVEDDFIKQFHKSSIKRIDEYATNSELDRFRVPPVFDNGWLLLCTNKSYIGKIKKLHPDQNTILIRVKNKSELQTVIDSLERYDYKVVDNYYLEDIVVVNWVKDRLQCSSDEAWYLYHRVAGRLKELVEAVKQLSGSSFISKSLIRTKIDKVQKVTVLNVVNYLLGVEKKYDYKDIVQWLYEFQNTGKWLKESVLRELHLYYECFVAIGTGELSLLNYTNFINSGDKRFKGCSKYKMKYVIELHNCISIEYVYFLILSFEKLGNSNKINDILNIVRIGGKNVYFSR